MKTTMRRAALAAVAASILVLVRPVAAAATTPGPAEQPPGLLSGLDEIYVRVDYVSEIVTDSGLKDNDLLIELANRIRDAGFLVLSATPDEASGPMLALTLESVELPTGDVALHGALELREPVNVVRLPGVSTLGSTWYSSVLSATPRSGIVDESRSLVDALADDFIGDAVPDAP